MKTVVASVVLVCATFGAAVLYARWFVVSGRLQALIEKKAGEATGTNVRMKSFSVSWPPKAECKDLSVFTSGYEDSPLLTCPRLTVAASLASLIKGRIDSIVLVGPNIILSSDKQNGSNIPDFPSRDGSFSFGDIKIIDAQINLDLPVAQVTSRGILATLSTHLSSAEEERIVKLNVDAIDASIVLEDQQPIPCGLRMIQAKFVQRVKSPGNEIEGEIHSALSAEVPELALPQNIPIQISFELDHFPERDSIENGICTLTFLPSTQVRLYGSVRDISGGTPTSDLNFSVTPIDISTLSEYVEPLQRLMERDIGLEGKLRIHGDMKGSLTTPEISVRADAEQGQFEWKGFTVEGLQVELPLVFEDGAPAIEAARVSATKATVPVGDKNFEITSLNGIVAGDASGANLQKATARFGNVGEVSFDGSYEFASGFFSGNARMKDAPIGNVLAYAAPVIGAIPDDTSVSGLLDFDIGIDVQLGSKPKTVGAKYHASLRDGEISVGEFYAAAGVNAALDGKLAGSPSDSLWKFESAGEAGNFEILIDTFYKDFSEIRFPFSLSGEYVHGTNRIQNANASLDFGPIGKLVAQGTAGLSPAPEVAMRLRSERIDLGRMFEEMGGELLSQFVPDLQAANINGMASGDVEVTVLGKKLNTAGSVRLSDGRIELPDKALRMDSISIDLPFAVYFPQEQRADPVLFEPQDYGTIAIGNATAGPIQVSSLSFDTALKGNSVSIKGPTSLDIFGGTVTLGAVEGKNVFGAGASATTSMHVRDLALEEIAEALELPRVRGTLNADLPEIRLSLESISADGSAAATVFDGMITIESLGIEKPLSSVRTFKAGVGFSDINLSAVTDVLDFGSISGIMEGTLSEFELSQGQPAAFVADFQTVKRKGVRQRINFDAVENITILGTGQGFQFGLGRGFASFFDEFGYDTIGFYCTLKNDNFRMKGKVVRGDTEYFVKGVMIGPQINVINRNPGQTVSFKSMLERINRIKTKDENN